MSASVSESLFPRLRDRFDAADRDLISKLMTRATRVGIVLHDPGGRIVFFNPKACDLLRMSPDELLHRSPRRPQSKPIHLDGSDYADEDQPTVQCLRTGETVVDAVMGVRVGDFSLRWLSLDVYPIELESGRYAMATVTDITSDIDNRRRLAETVDDLTAMLFPPDVPSDDRVRFASRYRSMGVSDSIGGDFFGFDEWGTGRYGMFLGDVCGHGIKAAVLGSIARTTIRAVGPILGDPGSILHRLHDVVLAERPDTFLTAVCAVVELDRGGANVKIASGGHPAAVVVSDGECTTFGVAGPLVGMIGNCFRPVREHRLRPGDRMLLMSDGILECAVPRLELEDVLADVPVDADIESLVDWMLDLSGDVTPDQRTDDASVIGISIC